MMFQMQAALLGYFLLFRSGLGFMLGTTLCRQPVPQRGATPCRPSVDLHTKQSTKLPSTDRDVTSTSDDTLTTLQTTTTPTVLLDPQQQPVLLALLDGLVLFVFAAIGKSSHSASGAVVDLLATAQTAAPFWVAWYATSGITQSYATPNASLREAALQAVRAWVVAIPLGIVLRGVIKGAVPPLSFAIVTMVATLVLLVGARVGWYAVVSGVNHRDELE